MAKNLVIVESPAKAATIEKYLGSDYQVLASMGHVRDLPASKMGVDVEAEFLPSYVIPPKARKTLTALKNALKGKDTVYLATDLDREGEAIAWHVAEALGLSERPEISVKRITFDEITQTAIKEAVAHPREIDKQLVDAQQARRALDRLVGYTLSPILWKKIYKGLSAGRVQSVALRIVVEREREREAFNPVEYWSLEAEFKTAVAEIIRGQLISYEGKKIEQLTLSSESEVSAITEYVRLQSPSVLSVDSKRQKRKPAAPYTTSKLQQDGVNRLGMSAKRVMQAAQRLYENGHITYMRTDSVALASSAVEAIRSHVLQVYGEQYLPVRPNVYSATSKGAQEAHEAIRPTDPSKSQVSAEASEQRLYEMIRRRAISSQMKEAEFEMSSILVSAGTATFKASGQRLIFPGYLAVWETDTKESSLPAVNQGESVDLSELYSEQHFTEPPPRYTEASLIKKLEELGIGRPSTYAPTISTLGERGYVRNESKQLVPEDVGRTVTDLLTEHFSNIVDTNFTVTMEQDLDGIADGTTSYAKVLGDFWHPFNAQVVTNESKIVKVEETETSDELCPLCEAPMNVKRSRFGKFLACSRFPECRGTKSLEQIAPTGLLCPRCGKDLSEKRARRGVFFGCSGYPDCAVALWKKEQLPAKVAELEGEGTEVPFKAVAMAAFELLGLEPAAIRPPRVKVETKKPVAKKVPVKKAVVKKVVVKKVVVKKPAVKKKAVVKVVA